MAMKQEANTPVVLTIGGMSIFLILVIMFGVEAWFRYEQKQEVARLWETSPNTWLINLRGGQLERLEAPAGDNAATRQKHMPIADAMGIIAKGGGIAPAASQPAASTPSASAATQPDAGAAPSASQPSASQPSTSQPTTQPTTGAAG